jgi:hypothetical protein
MLYLMSAAVFMELGTVVHKCNPNSQEDVAGNHEFEARLGYTARPKLKKPKTRGKGG